MRDETKCLHSGYTPANGAPGVPPIVQSTTYTFDSAAHIGELFDMPTEHMYSRFSNPTVAVVEEKIADLEGGVAAMCTSSGQAASLMSILNICSAGDSFICSASVYGGTLNLFAVTLKKFGIECIFVDATSTYDEIVAAFKPNTKAVFGETLANPTLVMLDIETFARAAHDKGVPLIIDNTFPTPILCKPIEFGADIVVHSTSKYLDGHALQVGGVIVDGGRFDWKNGNFPDFTTPDDSYHGIVYTEAFGNLAYIIKARMQLMRDFGAYPSAHSGFLLNIGLETLPIRMQRYCENGLAMAEFLMAQSAVDWVRYPGLPSDDFHELAQKYMPGGSAGVISFALKQGKEAAIKFMDALRLVKREVHVADIRSCILHPASSTHRQLTEEQLIAANVHPGLMRLSVGLENISDIIEDVSYALGAMDY